MAISLEGLIMPEHPNRSLTLCITESLGFRPLLKLRSLAKEPCSYIYHYTTRSLTQYLFSVI